MDPIDDGDNGAAGTPPFDPFTDTSDETFRITTPEQMVDYLNRLAVRAEQHPDEIENITSARLIEAAAGWAENIEFFFGRRGIDLADVNPWQFAAMLMAAGLIYE